eukprot:COSAG01_NODE_971_length_12373_cov_114.625957_3_plen_2066_part_00
MLLCKGGGTRLTTRLTTLALFAALSSSATPATTAADIIVGGGREVKQSSQAAARGQQCDPICGSGSTCEPTTGDDFACTCKSSVDCPSGQFCERVAADERRLFCTPCSGLTSHSECAADVEQGGCCAPAVRQNCNACGRHGTCQPTDGSDRALVWSVRDINMHNLQQKEVAGGVWRALTEEKGPPTFFCHCKKGFGGEWCMQASCMSTADCSHGKYCSQDNSRGGATHGVCRRCDRLYGPLGSNCGNDCDEVSGSCCSAAFIAKCGGSPCGEHGNCTDRGNTFECACDAGFEAHQGPLKGCNPSERCVPPSPPGGIQCTSTADCSHGKYCSQDNSHDGAKRGVCRRCDRLYGPLGSNCGNDCDEVSGSCCSAAFIAKCGGSPCGEHGNCTDRGNTFECACDAGFEAHQGPLKGCNPSERCVPPCRTMSDCSFGEYCAQNGKCQGCDQVTKTKCDAIDNSCCSVEFLASCRDNPHVCNEQIDAKGMAVPCPDDSPLRGPCCPTNPCGNSTANVCDSSHDKCAEDGNGKIRIDYGVIHCSCAAGYTNKFCADDYYDTMYVPRTPCLSDDDCETSNCHQFPHLPCEGLPCSVPEDEAVTNGRVVRGTSHPYPGESVKFECDDGYEMDGMSTATCDTRGRYTVPTCRGKKCVPPSLTNGLVASGGGGRYPGKDITFDCKQGYTMRGPKMSKCDTTGNYRLPTCDLQQCDPGHEPNTDQTACQRCAPNYFSPSGFECQKCEHPRVVGNQNSTCEPCRAGQGPSPDHTGCISCSGTNYSITGTCIDCAKPNIVDEGFTRCRACEPGKAPNEDRTKCDNCAAGTYSTHGVECELCERPRVTTEDMVGCHACQAGSGPSKDATQCNGCTRGKISTYGEKCHECCQDCELIPNKPENGTACVSPFYCPPGKQCPNGRGQCRIATECQQCSAGQVTDRQGTKCYNCSSPGQRANDDHTRCQSCDPGKQPASDHDSCIDCVGLNFSLHGVACQPCQDPNYVDPDTHKDCRRCAEGSGPNPDRTGCIPCQGNTATSGTGTCTPCKYGYMHDPRHTACHQCGARETFVTTTSPTNQESNMTGRCGCGTQGGPTNNGYYDASHSLIVCLHDGFKQADVDIAVKRMDRNTRGEINPCQECPSCVDCSNGFPLVRDGYTLGKDAVLPVDTDPRIPRVALPNKNVQADGTILPVHYVFFCDEDTAVTPTDLEVFSYFTTKIANTRCYHNCKISETKCDITAIQAVQLSVSNASLQSSGVSSEQGNSLCSNGYDGSFCRSCQQFDAGIAFYRPPGNRECLPCSSADAAINWPAIFCVVLFCVLMFAVLWKWKSRRRHMATNLAETQSLHALQEIVEQMTSADDSDSNESSRLVWLFEQLGLLRVVIMPPLRTLITYAQVTGQLSHVLHVQYPKSFTNTVSHFRWLRDVWSLFFSPACAGYGSFYDLWVLRVVCQPLLFALVATSIYCVDRWFALSGTASAAWNKWRQNILRVVFLCYPSVCNAAFSALDCRHDGPDSFVLIDDDRQKCGTSKHEIFKWLSILVIIGFGFFMPVFVGYQVWRAVSSARHDLAQKHLIYERAQAELLPPRLQAGELAHQQWKGTCTALCLGCCSSKYKNPSEGWMERNADLIKYKQIEAEREFAKHIEGAFIESTRLGDYVSLTDAYKPDCWSAHWESVDMLRKLTLVGLVVLAGRGSMAQNICSSMLSFFFFALHVKIWPMKMHEDNILRASCEFHVFLTILTAFVMKSDLSHESLGIDGYGNILILTFIVCVPGAFCATMLAKYRRTLGVARSDLSLAEYSRSYIPGQEFVRFSSGLALSDDRERMRKYFENRSSRITQAQVFEDYATQVLDHRGRSTFVLQSDQLRMLLARLSRPTDVESLDRAADVDTKKPWQPGSSRVKLLRTPASTGETREIVQVWKWETQWQVYRELEKSDDSLAGRQDIVPEKLVKGAHVQMRGDASKKGVVLQRAWTTAEILVDFNLSAGNKEWVHVRELAVAIVDEPAVDDPVALQTCQLQINQAIHQLPIVEGSANFLEFIEWWGRRQRYLLEQQLQVAANGSAENSRQNLPSSEDELNLGVTT